MNKNYDNLSDYNRSWYAMTPNKLVQSLGGLKGEVNCDVCVIGGGFTGLSAALSLAENGFSTVLIDAGKIAGSASGLNGGHVQRGYSKGVGWMLDHYGMDATRAMTDLTFEGLKLITDRIAQYNIDCDLKFGHLTAATRDSHIGEIKDDIKDWEKLGYRDLRCIEKSATQDLARTEKYIGGMYDETAGHFHPYNYALGLAAACQSKNVRIYEDTKALKIEQGGSPKVIIGDGVINSKFVIIAGAINLPETKSVMRHSISATAHMVATEPLGEERARKILSKDIAVIDANFIMNYYRFSADHRLLFGGNVNYSARDYGIEAAQLRQNIIDLYPDLKDIRIDHCWHGPLDLTGNRLPDIGRLSNNVFFAHGFGGHGVVVTNIVGKLLAEAVSGTMSRFDLFNIIKHPPIFGGEALKRPLFVAAMMWFRLRDKLS